jgi:colanic acid/amylovoran biosynthesis glycosyltransferase
MPTFAELTGLKVVPRPGGRFVLTRKFIEGMTYYAAHWPGPVVAVMDPTHEESPNLDNVEVAPEEIPFAVQCLRYDSAELRRYIAGCGFVHWGPHHLLHDLGDVLQSAGVPNVYCMELSLQTRCQIIAANVANPLIRLRRYFWEWQEDRRIRRNLPRTSGFEANGTPAFERYGSLSERSSLFFDNRMASTLMISDARLESRLRDMEGGKNPLRLVFSGRLVSIKGAMDVIAVAEALRKRGVAFRLSICGGGPLEAEMRARISSAGLSDCITLKGTLDFATELIPFVSSHADVFVCCHKQGDPSCTYLETFGCGVPIAGYLNEAFDGLLRQADVGWGVPLHQADKLADVLMRLDRNRGEISAKARRAAAFARANDMETTFARRMAFFAKCAGLAAVQGGGHAGPRAAGL